MAGSVGVATWLAGSGVGVGPAGAGVTGADVGAAGGGVGVGGSGVGAGDSPRAIKPTSSIQNCSCMPKKGAGTKENSLRRSFQVLSMRTKTVMIEFWATAETCSSGQIL